MNSSNPQLTRSSSSNLIHSKSTTKHFTKPEQSLSRNSSLENCQKIQHKHLIPALNPSPFIKPKPSQHFLKPSSSQSLLPKPSEKPGEKVYPTCLKDYAFLDEITSKFTLKTIDAIKKDFAANEGLYSHFLAVLAELDKIFEKNQQLQFSMSRAREVFHLYMSRPGHVLNTFKCLPKLAETVRVSKKVISQCANALKTFDKSKVNGITSDVIEALRLVVSIQNKVFKAKVFIPSSRSQLKTQENLVTDEKTFDVSIMEFNNPSEFEFRSVSPLPSNDENFDPRATNEKKSTKARILEQLFMRIKSMPGAQVKEEHSTEKNRKKSECGEERCLIEIKENIRTEKSATKVKQKPSGSISPTPNYMQSLKRQASLGTNQKVSQKYSKIKAFSSEKKKEWEEIRMRKKQEADQKRRELLEEIEAKRKQQAEMQEFLIQKQKLERVELMRYKEEELKEQKRLKQLQKQQKKMELMDEVARNIEKSYLGRSVDENL